VYPRGCKGTAICEFFDPMSWGSILTTSPETDCPVRCEEVEEFYAMRHDKPESVLCLGSGRGRGKLYEVR
jgi:hypothetical protein